MTTSCLQTFPEYRHLPVRALPPRAATTLSGDMRRRMAEDMADILRQSGSETVTTWDLAERGWTRQQIDLYGRAAALEAQALLALPGPKPQDISASLEAFQAEIRKLNACVTSMAALADRLEQALVPQAGR